MLPNIFPSFQQRITQPRCRRSNTVSASGFGFVQCALECFKSERASFFAAKVLWDPEQPIFPLWTSCPSSAWVETITSRNLRSYKIGYLILVLSVLGPTKPAGAGWASPYGGE